MSETTAKPTKRLTELAAMTANYDAFERRVMSFPRWYLQGLQAWTRKDLRAFHDKQRGKV